VRKSSGIAALVLLAVALNLMVGAQQVFSFWVLAPLTLSLVLGIVWLALTIGSMAGQARFEGRAAGRLNAVFSSVIFLGICMVVFAMVKTWNVSWDLTQEGRRSLSPQTVQVLRGMTKEVKVTCFFLNVEEELVVIARDKTQRFLEQCQQYTDFLKVEFLDPQVDRARLDELKVTHKSVQGTVVLNVGTRQRVITLSGGSPRMEERDFTNALVNVLRDSEPKVCFLTGHHERDILDEGDSGASMLKNLLEGEAYKTERIAIKISAPEIPPDCDVLVIHNPTGDLHPQEITALDAYADRGGRLLVLMDPWKNVRAGRTSEQLRPWLEKRFGVNVGSDMALTDQQTNPWQMELTTDQQPFAKTETGFMAFRGCFNGEHPITRGFDQSMLLEACRSVQAAADLYQGASVTPLLRTTPDFWAETDVAKVFETRQAKLDDGERKGPITLAVAAAARAKAGAGNPREARAVVVGDSEFASNFRMNVPGNFNFVLNAFAWLSEHEELIAIRPSGKEAPPLVLSERQQRAIAWLSTLFTAQLVTLAGLVVFWARRKHQ